MHRKRGRLAYIVHHGGNSLASELSICVAGADVEPHCTGMMGNRMAEQRLASALAAKEQH